MAKHDEKFKRTVVEAYLLGEGGYLALAATYGVPPSLLRQWVGCYREHGDAGLRKKYSHYSAPFKLSVLTRMWQQELSCKQTAVIFDLRGGGAVVSDWERRYRDGGLNGLEPKRRGRPKKLKIPTIKELGAVQAHDTPALENLHRASPCTEVLQQKKLNILASIRKPAAPKKHKL